MINWKVRLKNKTFLITFIVAVLGLIYNVLGMLGIIPTISQDTVTELIIMVVNILVTLGIVIDPTTQGTGDSKQALTYIEPK